MARSERRALPAGAPDGRESIGDLVLHTLPGRALVVGAAVRVLASVTQLAVGPSPVIDAIGAVGTLVLLAGLAYFTWRLVSLAKRRLLWRVRRKLILSYIFVGLVPALLIIVFFALCGLLLFSTVSSYVVQTRLRSLVDQAQFLARTSAIELDRADSTGDLRERLTRKQANLRSRYPDASLAVLPASRTCASEVPGTDGPDLPAEPLVAGPWPHLPPPTQLPRWIGCSGFAGVMAYWVGPPGALNTAGARSNGTRLRTDRDTAGRTRLFVRAVALPDGPAPRYAVVLDVPVSDLVALRLREETGIELRGISVVRSAGGAVQMQGRVTEPPPVADDSSTSSRLQPKWVVFIDFTDWNSGRAGIAAQSFGMRVREIYDQLSPSKVNALGMTFGQVLILMIVVVGLAFLLIQFVALVMGLALARSITASVHELFIGTERLKSGDFTHQIRVLAKDQLGELAEQFNMMTLRLGGMMAAMAEKKRLEEELRIARKIQMSLLPESPPMRLPGVSIAASCTPAREVGGDYYDFLPIDEHRLGLLIADVSGKGASAAFYMAELKGLMLSLSRIHRSPRDLLIEANTIISDHLDNRSFITVTYAVLDLRSRTLTWARAGHTPLIRLAAGAPGERRAEVLVPNGLVLGLKIDTGERFSALLEEVTLPLQPGDVFVFFTDGISEQMNTAEEMFGEGRLGALVEEHAEQAPEELRERIVREVRAFAGEAAQHDDMTFILVRVNHVEQTPAGAGARAEEVLV
jgi:serine phosphatase RsbU (regulator of sigma subunit)/HAMP domain-containing protein